MIGSIVVMPGSDLVDLPALQAVAAEFGWAARENDPRLAAAPRALLLHRGALGPGKSWLEIVQSCRFTFPGVRLIVCHSLAESIDWPALSRAGAFHALALPLREGELRQSLGFVWEAEARLAACAQRLLEIAPVRKSRAARQPVSDRSRGFYAPRAGYETA